MKTNENRKSNPKLQVVPTRTAIPVPAQMMEFAPESSREISQVTTMPKAPKNTWKAPKVSPGPLGPVEQVREALKPRTRLATAIGFFLGGFVPIATCYTAHYEVDWSGDFYKSISFYMVLGGLLYSMKTVHEWGKVAFRDWFKATGFVILLEGVMITSHNCYLTIAALIYLVMINGVATGCNLSVPQMATPKIEL